MKFLMVWMRDNTLVALTMIIFTAAATFCARSVEVTAADYKTLANIWPRAHRDLRIHIKTAIADGSISKWEYTKLMREAMDDVGAIVILQANNLVVERSNLQQLADQVSP